MRITVVCPSYPPTPGGVSDFTQRWAEALVGAGGEDAPVITLVTAPGAAPDAGVSAIAPYERWGFRGIPALLRTVVATQPDVVVLQYVPHLYERRGLSLPIALVAAGLRRRGVPVVTIAHELYYGRHEGWRVQPFGWVQRLALWPLAWGSRRFVVTVPDRLTRLCALFPAWRERFVLLPVGGNLQARPPVDRGAWLAAHDVPDDGRLLLMLGLGHPSKEMPMLASTLDALAAAGVPARLLLVGGASLAHPRAHSLGYLPPAEAEAALGLAELFVLPLADGASTRRTSLMNALAAGLPVVSTLGANTDTAMLPTDVLRLVPAGDAGAFAGAVVSLATDADARRALGDAGRSLYDRAFAWPVLAERWRGLLEEAVHPG